jgi:riboflavin-specific deaminase-like protein
VVAQVTTLTETADYVEFDAWALAHAAAKTIGTFDTTRPARFSLGATGRLCLLTSGDPRAVLFWNPSSGWEPTLAPDDPQRDLLDLYLPISSASAERPITIGHLGQSLDGFIATPSGDSCFVTGPQNILHLHRLRALCDAVVVGAGTVTADNPRLTTRLVAGSNPVRVVLDPAGRLSPTHIVFNDRAALTLRACAAGNVTAAADVLEVAVCGEGLDLKDLLAQLHARGYWRIFVEGGGVTVSSFLEAGLLDRLHIAVAPLLIGDGRPSVRMLPHARLQDCLRLNHRVYRAGEDILFDCDLRNRSHGKSGEPAVFRSASLQRIL